jgi:hypothetical protein
MRVTRWLALSFLAFLAFIVSSLWPAASRADEADAPNQELSVARAAANDDAFTPGLAKSAGKGRAFAAGVVSYDSALRKTALDLNGDVQLFGPVRLTLRVDNVTGGNGGNARPGIGAAVQFLDEGKHGVSSTAYFAYKAEGFAEAEGELEGLVAFGKQLGPMHGTLNLAYGQDPEGKERDGELAVGLHVEPRRGLFTGVIGRFRDALGSNGDKGTGVLRDALGAATATYVFGNIGVTAMAGIAGVKTTTDSAGMKTGAAAALSVGTVF